MKKSYTLACLMVVVIGVSGCGGSSATRGAGDVVRPESERTHGIGPHGGIVFDWGKYHAELTVDHKKQEATVYILGEDMKTAAPVKIEKLRLVIKDPSFDVELKATPQDGEGSGATSRFVGKHEMLGKELEFEGVLIGALDDKPIIGGFKEEPKQPKK